MKLFVEMRHEPFFVRGIARESAAELVINAARSHPFTGMQHHLDRFLIVESHTIAQQKCRMTWRGEFGGGAKAAMNRVVTGFELPSGVAQGCVGQDDWAGVPVGQL